MAGTFFHRPDTFSCTSKILLFDIETKNLTKKNAQTPGGHVFQPTGTIFELIRDIVRTILVTNFHEDRTINVAYIDSNVLLKPHIAIKGKMSHPPPGGHVFKATLIIFELMQDIIDTHHVMKFHKD
ncbi:hypothetical protein DPMN_124599 [Dreissena polymorpha]|uniref:Uncharacterized protein n=1 Tax=Dreissena polymorpha TaxID=45954 RepID=A0A9D4GVW9_DREPO|nr:hypothetical protein DPMN_124599 [Dreissena polymorpha]